MERSVHAKIINATTLLNSDNYALPKYQRGKAWSDAQRKSFIDFVSKGYPAGGAFVHKTSDSEQWRLADGQQRCLTLLDFVHRPAKYFQDYDEFIDELWNIIKRQFPSDISQNKKANIKNTLQKSIEECLSGNQENINFLRDTVVDKFNIRDAITISDGDALNEVQQNILRKIRDYLDINDIQFSLTEFIGPEEEAREIFNALNTKGTKLNQYEIYAGQWCDDIIQLDDSDNSDALIDRVIKYYDELQKGREIALIGFDEQEIRSSRKVNLAELCNALGDIICIRTPALFWREPIQGKH